MELILVLLLFQGVVVGLFCSYVAKTKGRSGLNWFLLGLGFSGLALLALVAVPKLEPEGVAGAGPQGLVGTVTPIRPSEQYGDEMDISLLAYQLFLTKQYSIERNATLGVFSIHDEAFVKLEDALRVADRRYRQQMAQREVDAAKANADAAKARADAAERDTAAAAAEANRAAMDQREAARRKKGMTIAIPVVAVLAFGLWLLKPYGESFFAEMKKAVDAESKVRGCTELPDGESARCLKVLKAKEKCSHLGGIDSIFCQHDYLNR